jgi:hypothetical protein
MLEQCGGGGRRRRDRLRVTQARSKNDPERAHESGVAETGNRQRLQVIVQGKRWVCCARKTSRQEGGVAAGGAGQF